MKKIEKMIHQIIRFRGNIEAFLVSIEEFSRSSCKWRLQYDEYECELDEYGEKHLRIIMSRAANDPSAILHIAP